MSAYNIVISFYYIFFSLSFSPYFDCGIGTLSSGVRFQVQLTKAAPTLPLHLGIGRQAVGISISRCCISTFPIYVALQPARTTISNTSPRKKCLSHKYIPIFMKFIEN